jgi:prepilin-type processing-associated H-X9-DG protein
VITEEQLQGAGKLAGTPISIIYCPSRRAAIAYPWSHDDTYTERSIVNAHVPLLIAKLDYAINGGESPYDQETYKDGPTTLAGAESFTWRFDRLGNQIEPSGSLSLLSGKMGLNGISFRRSEVGARQVTDGISNTYSIGEKHVPYYVYESGEVVPDEIERHREYGGDRMPWVLGYSYGTTRFAVSSPEHDQYVSERVSTHAGNLFGSAHGSGAHIAFCDGSVRVVEYNIDRGIHAARANRSDGTIHGLGGYEATPPRWPR